MGTWGAGNFESDGALDFVGDVMDRLETEVRAFADAEEPAIEDCEDVVMPAVAIMVARCQSCSAPPPKEELVARWRAKYLSMYDEQIGGLDPDERFKAERRAIIERTFAALEEQASVFWQQ